MLIILASAIVWKALRNESNDPVTQLIVILFSLLVFTSGLFCIILEKYWFVGLSPKYKVPM